MKDEYRVEIAQTAENDLADAVNYIQNELREPVAARRLLEKAQGEISTLSQHPKRFPLVREKSLAAEGYRFIPVNNYLVFYVVDAPGKTVYIIRFLYGHRNWKNIL